MAVFPYENNVCFPVKILLAKLWHYGIRGVANKWFDSYLNNRKQLVEVNDICSDTKIIEFGVGEGKVV